MTISLGIEIAIINLETIVFVHLINNSLPPKRFSQLAIMLMLCGLQTLHRVLMIEVGLLSIVPSLLFDSAVVFFGYDGELRKKIFLIVLFYSLSIVFDASSELLMAGIYSLLKIEPIVIYDWPLPSVFLSKLALLTVTLITGKTLRTENDFKDWLRFMPVPIVVVSVLIWESPFNREFIGNPEMTSLLVIICILSLIVNIFIIVIFQRNDIRMKLEYRLNALEENHKISRRYSADLKEAYIKIERLAHDMKQHLNYLGGSSSLEQVHDYVQKLQGRNFYGISRYTGNFDIDVIINAKQHEANENGISIQIEGNILPERIDWISPVDISIILGNALSNAIEACERDSGKAIHVVFRYDDNWLSVTLSNPVSRSLVPKQSSIGFISSKEGDLHGIGMESMASSAELYDGFMRYNIIDGIFTLSILLQRGKIS